jgi:Uma2 family endonuclease
MRTYEKFGVKEYWIIDVKNEWLERYVLTEGKFDLEVYLNSSAFFCGVLPELEIKISDVFRNVGE